MKENGFGIASMVLGIIGLLLSCVFIGLYPAIFGLSFSIVGLTKKNVKYGTAIAGLICSIIAILISGYVYLLFFKIANVQ